MIKRLFDVTVSIVGLIITAPLLIIVAFLIKVKSPGPVFFRGERVGKNGKKFKIYKLRTIIVEAK
jgi:lipopolysaccharide/colanic/teichoic acid biosynthesis glycosyltransferase